MSFNSDSVQDSFLQHEDDIDVWEIPLRSTQRQDRFAGGQVQHPHQVEVETALVDLNSFHEHGVDRLMPLEADQENMSEPGDSSAHVIEDHRLRISADSSERRVGGPSTWPLSTAVLRQQNQTPVIRGHAGREMHQSALMSQSTYSRLFSVQGIGANSSSSQHRPLQELVRKANDICHLGVNRQRTRKAKEMNLKAAHGSNPQPSLEPSSSHPPAAASGSYPGESNKAYMDTAIEDIPDWEEMRRRSLIASHPLYPHMLAMHVACLRVVTPEDQLPGIEAQLIDSPKVAERYSALCGQITDVSPEEQEDLDQFMRNYTLSLQSFAQTLGHHVETSVTEALTSCWEIEQELYNLTGARPEPGSGKSWSDSESDEGFSSDDFGPLLPSESERTLMERVKQDLKLKLKQGYNSEIIAIREEIVRQRGARKLPEGATAILKNWWEAHATWPYPTEKEKLVLVEQTGMRLNQVNNWFVNQRKRNPGHAGKKGKGKALKR